MQFIKSICKSMRKAQDKEKKKKTGKGRDEIH
jgi:hypothetical protein